MVDHVTLLSKLKANKLDRSTFTLLTQVIYKQPYSTGFIQRTDIDRSILGPLLFV